MKLLNTSFKSLMARHDEKGGKSTSASRTIRYIFSDLVSTEAKFLHEYIAVSNHLIKVKTRSLHDVNLDLDFEQSLRF